MATAKQKPILCLDFDGVLHSYVSGWQGPRRIPDGPTEDAMGWLLNYAEHFHVAILSSRSHCFLGRFCMKQWIKRHLRQHLIWLATCNKHEQFRGLESIWTSEDFAPPPVSTAANDIVREVMREISFPRHKPPATVTLDDRAVTFTGKFPPTEDLLSFTPWNRSRGNNPPHEKPEPVAMSEAPLDPVNGEPSRFHTG